ncbi:hypothetical protein NC651_012159 [Populus alba x Populus x berolinensis]|nr:hypothetical protein NC651_012159 [Populus alba x Populus x berolinensis]
MDLIFLFSTIVSFLLTSLYIVVSSMHVCLTNCLWIQ